MTPQEYLDILKVAERLKDATRHSYTSGGRHESVAEHTWMITLMAMLLEGEEEFRNVDVSRVIKMCIIHDLGEAFTGDIPAFMKKDTDETAEADILAGWFDSFPEPQRTQILALHREMNEMVTPEARAYKAMDKLEALIQHNEADISTWLPLEYDLQLNYGRQQTGAFEFTAAVREAVDDWTRQKIAQEGQRHND